jgi:hypothetical protein
MTRDIGHHDDLIIDFVRLSSVHPVCLGFEVDRAVDIFGCHLRGHLEEGREPVAEQSAYGRQTCADHGDTYFDYGPDRGCHAVPFEERLA